jgi:outer membrane protein assembly factor BamD (BamD/ComL family)
MPPTDRNPREPRPRAAARRRARAPLGVALAGLAVLSGAGCQATLSGPLARWRMGTDSSLSPGPTDKELGPENRSFIARWIKPKAPVSSHDDLGPTLVLGSNGWSPMKTEANPEADAEFKAAETLFQQGKLEDAETAFATLAKKRKGTPWGERGQYYLAETQFQRGKLVTAHDSYELLMKDYPGTDRVDKVVKREFAIAQTWLAQYDPKSPPESRLPWSAHFDGREPWIDVRGHALRALEHVRHHNPQGELADDAVLRIADEHFAQGDYDTAALYYDQLITDHPKSPFLQRAQLATIDSRMKGYIGPEYDGSGLEKAREMVKQTMATFPDRLAGGEKLYHTLDLINDQEAERTYVVGAYYKRAGYPTSAEYYFAKVVQRHPKSPWAAKAKTELASLAKTPRTRHDPSKIMTAPGSTDSFFNGPNSMMGGMGGMGGMGMGGMGGMGMPGGMN